MIVVPMAAEVDVRSQVCTVGLEGVNTLNGLGRRGGGLIESQF